jgi:hypothetical protein
MRSIDATNCDAAFHASLYEREINADPDDASGGGYVNAMAEPIIFDNSGMVPAQFFSGRRDGARMEPFRRLALAVLVDAVHIFQTKFGTSQPSCRREFNEAREWLLGPSGDGPFAFENVCFLLDVDPSRLRTWLTLWLSMRRAGLPCRVLPQRLPVHRTHSIRPSTPRPDLERTRGARNRRKQTTEREPQWIAGIH